MKQARSFLRVFALLQAYFSTPQESKQFLEGENDRTVFQSDKGRFFLLCVYPTLKLFSQRNEKEESVFNVRVCGI